MGLYREQACRRRGACRYRGVRQAHGLFSVEEGAGLMLGTILRFAREPGVMSGSSRRAMPVTALAYHQCSSDLAAAGLADA